MKILILLLFLTSFLPGKTWVELAKEADYHLDHPGRRKTKVTPNSPDLEYLQLSRKTLEQISSGADARCPTKAGGCFFRVTGCLLDLNHLIEFHASQQEWEQVDDSLKLATRFRRKILTNEPTSSWLLTSTITTYCIIRVLDDLPGIADPGKRKARLQKLYHHWENLQISEADLLVIKTGEIRRFVNSTTGLSDYLEGKKKTPDKPPLLFSFHDKISLTESELRDLKFDAPKSKTVSKDDAEIFFKWIASKKPLDQLPKLNGRDPNRQLPFYLNHPNGLFHYYRDSWLYLNIPRMAAAQRLKRATQRACFLWLLAESSGRKINHIDQLTRNLPLHLHDEFAHEHSRIDFKARVIDVSEHPLKLKRYPKNITVPNLFPN